ncbi:hypothetical protein CXB51_004928 [Gossypium anomalum]|uniref:Uncharacterized protein n=1 Tax=Gossypium anomalum TaxID=47600 RepID=A0A8J5ZF20_9ROSI|nr:hypothetical protein CXB51_004928 [Gossypium anomalum]
MIISHLPRIGSDYRPLLLSVPCNIISAPTPLFHYLVVWKTYPNFDSFLQKKYKVLSPQYYPSSKSESYSKIKDSISIKEVKSDATSMQPLKALGCDGLPTTFFQKTWFRV